MNKLDGQQLYNACMSYTHDFGLLSGEERQKVEWQAKEWFRCFLWDYEMNLREKGLKVDDNKIDMVKIKVLEWKDVSEEYNSLETYMCETDIGFYAAYLDQGTGDYVFEHAIDKESLFYPPKDSLSPYPTLDQAKQSAQEYHNKLVLSLLED